MIQRKAYPLGNPKTKSLAAPSGWKLATFHQEVCLLSFGPKSDATVYLTIVFPVLVSTSSGCAARRPMTWILAYAEREVVEKARALATAGRNIVRRDILTGAYVWVV
jgi:hypothetical protein